MPVRVTTAPSTMTFIRPTEQWQTMEIRLSNPADFKVDENFYVEVRQG